MEREHADPVGAGRGRRVLITGAGGQLGHALQQVFSADDVLALTHADWDVAHPASEALSRGEWDLVLHTAAWTNVDGAEADPQGAAAVNVAGTAHAAALKAPLVTFSTDYVFDGRKRSPYAESDAPNPMSAYGRTKLHAEAAAGPRAWIVRTSWLFGETGHNFVRTMLRLGAERDDIWMVSAEGGELERWIDHPAVERRPRWSPDGALLVFHSTRSGGEGIWRVREGEDPERLAENGYGPCWSPDGNWVYFVGTLETAGNVWAVSNDGLVVRPMTDLSGRYGSLGFSQNTVATDGAYLYYIWREDRGDIWVADVTYP